MDLMRPPQSCSRHLAEPEVLDLTILLQLDHCFYSFLNRCLAVDPVSRVQVDLVRA